MKTLVAAIAAVLAAGSAAAQTIDVNFSFNDDPSLAGSLPGTVTGTLYGLPTTGTARPTGVTVNYAGVTYTYSSLGVYGDGFTTSNGVVTAANYQTTLSPAPGDLNLGLSGFNQLITNTDGAVINTGGFAGVTYTTVVAASPAVPEAASWAMMMVGLGVVGGAVRRRSDAKFDAKVKRIAAGLAA